GKFCVPGIWIVGWNWFIPVFGGKWCIDPDRAIDFFLDYGLATYFSAAYCIGGLAIMWDLCQWSIGIAVDLALAGYPGGLAALAVCIGAVWEFCGPLALWILIAFV